MTINFLDLSITQYPCVRGLLFLWCCLLVILNVPLSIPVTVTSVVLQLSYWVLLHCTHYTVTLLVNLYVARKKIRLCLGLNQTTVPQPQPGA